MSHEVAGRPLGPVFSALTRWAEGNAGPTALFCWAAAEAVLLPVIPDVLLGLLVLAVPRRLPALFTALCLGSLAGSLALFGITVVDPESVRGLLLALPGVDARTLADATTTVAGGSPTCLLLFGAGIPLKVYTFAWANGLVSPLGFLPAVILNRFSRILPLALAEAVIGVAAAGFLRRHERTVLAIYVAAWVAVYALYLG